MMSRMATMAFMKLASERLRCASATASACSFSASATAFSFLSAVIRRLLTANPMTMISSVASPAVAMSVAARFRRANLRNR